MVSEEALVSYKQELVDDDFTVEYEVLPVFSPSDLQSSRKNEICDAISDIDKRVEFIDNEVAKLNSEIERLTNNADWLDYTVAVASGVLCGMIDSFFVGEFDVEHFEQNKEKVTKSFEEFVVKKGEKARKDDNIRNAIKKAKENAAKRGEKLSKEKEEEIKRKITESLEKGYQERKARDAANGTKSALESALTKLQEKFEIPSDNLWSGAGIKVTADTHHLDDFAHHPTVIGLFAAIISVVFRVGIFVNKEGKWSLQIAKFKDKDEAKKWFLQIMLPITLSGLLTWLLYILKSNKKEEIDKKIPKPIQKLIVFLAEVPAIITILEITNNWLGHLVSDMAGSSTSAGKGREGMGIPGLFMSLFKYLSSIPPLNLTPLPGIVDELYRDERFDLRAEIATLDQLGKQAIPVIAGDLLVRSFYFIRRLAVEYKEHGDWNSVNWRNVIPFKNRTIVRMMTIESGTFMAIDLADAAIRSAVKNAGQVASPTFWKDFILRVNFVGIGRFAIAIGTDVGMGMKKSALENKRMVLMSEQIELLNARVFYYQENMGLQIDATEQSLEDLEKYIDYSANVFSDSYSDIERSIENIGRYIPEMEKKNPGLKDQLLDAMW